MTTYVALLRGINVGGHKKVAMSDLRDLLESLGFSDVKTLLNSGNVVFRSAARRADDLEKRLAAETKDRLGVESDFFLRTAEEWRAIIAANPFAEAAERDPAHLAVMCLSAAPEKADVEALRKAIVGREVVHVDGRTAYLIYPDGMGTSKLTITLIEKKLRARGTARNWNTVMKLAKLAGG